MLWYGMNIPNRIAGKTTLAPRNRHLARTYPFIEPSIADSTVAGTTSRTLFRKLGPRPRKPWSGLPFHACAKLLKYRPDGSDHIRLRLISAKLFIDVTTNT